MAQVQFANRTKYAGVYQPPHTPFKVKNADVPGLVESGAVVLVGPEQDPDPETEEERAARLLAEAKAEEDRIAAEEAEQAAKEAEEQKQAEEKEAEKKAKEEEAAAKKAEADAKKKAEAEAKKAEAANAEGTSRATRAAVNQ